MRATYGFRATLTAQPGRGGELAELLLSATVGDGPATNEHCLLYLVSRDAVNADVLHVTEGWTSQAAHAENFARPRTKAFTERLAPLVGGTSSYAGEVLVGGHLRGEWAAS